MASSHHQHSRGNGAFERHHFLAGSTKYVWPSRKEIFAEGRNAPSQGRLFIIVTFGQRAMKRRREVFEDSIECYIFGIGRFTVLTYYVQARPVAQYSTSDAPGAK